MNKEGEKRLKKYFQLKKYILKIETFGYSFTNVRSIMLGTYGTYNEAYEHWKNLMEDYPDHEGVFLIEDREKNEIKLPLFIELP